MNELEAHLILRDLFHASFIIDAKCRILAYMKSKEITIDGRRLTREKCYEIYSTYVPTSPSTQEVFMRLENDEIVYLLRRNGIAVSSLPRFDYGKLDSLLKGAEDGSCFAKAYGTYANPTDDLPIYHSFSYEPEDFDREIMSAVQYSFALYSHKKYILCYELIRTLFSFSFTTLFVDEFNNSHKETGFRLVDLYRGSKKKKYLEAVLLYLGMMAYVNPPFLAEAINRDIKDIKLSFGEASKYFTGPQEVFVSRLKDFIGNGQYFLFGRPEHYSY